MECTAASNILEGTLIRLSATIGFISPIDSTNVRKLRENGAIVTGKVNLDEFGMGSFGMYGYKGTVCLNAINEDYHTGGSSSGSGVAVKAYQCLGYFG